MSSEKGEKLTMYRFFIQYMRKKLNDAGINIDSDDYWKLPKWKDFEREYVLHRFAEQSSWWIEKNIVGQERLEKRYGPYELGIERELKAEEVKETVWFKDLADRYEEKNRTVENIRRYFYRNEISKKGNKNGLIGRLKSVGFDIERFDKEGNIKRYERERIKLLHFLYRFETENKVEIVPFLGTPTLENVDNGIIKDITKNGNLMKILKNTIAREVEEDFIVTVKKSLSKVVVDWEKQIKELILLLNLSVDENALKERLENICQEIERIAQWADKKGSVWYSHGVLETFYLKLSQHENLGRERDIIGITEDSLQYEPVIVEYQPDEYKKMAFETIRKEDVQTWLRNKRKELVCLVFGKEKVTSNEYKKYDAAVEKIKNFMDIADENTKAIYDNQFSKLLIISFLQEIIYRDKKEKIENSYYRYETNELKTLNADLNYGTEAHRKSQLALISRANIRFYRLAGKKEDFEYVRRAEKCIDHIMEKIFSCDNINDMLYLHNYFMLFINRVFVSVEMVQLEIDKFMVGVEKYVHGYKLYGEPQAILGFFRTVINTSISEQIGKLVGRKIEKMSNDILTVAWPIELTDTYHSENDNFELITWLGKKNKTIFFRAFVMKPEGKYRECLIRCLGLSKK